MNTEAKRFLKITLPTLGLLFLAACSSEAARPPTVEEVRAGLTRPTITTDRSLIYTNSSKPVETTAGWAYTCDFGSPNLTVIPAGPTATWERQQWLNPFSPKTKLKVAGMTANTAYEVRISASNCTEYRGERIDTEAIVKTVKIVYDTMPPQAKVSEVVARDGKLFITAQTTDNLSGPKEDKIERVVHDPLLGKNSVDVQVCDNAENCQTQTLEGNYDPFNQVVSMKVAKYDSQSGKIIIAGSINDPNVNIDAESTGIEAKQSTWPGISAGLECPVKVINGYDFQFRCNPRNDNGRTTATITITDKVGHTYTEPIEIDIPPLSAKKVGLFYSMIVLGILASSSIGIKIRGDRVSRERRLGVISAIAGHSKQDVEQAFVRMTKKDKKKYPNTVNDFDKLTAAQQLSDGGKIVESIAAIRGLYEKPNILLEAERDNTLTTIIGRIHKMIAKRDWHLLEQPEIKIVLDFLANTRHNRAYAFFWERVSRSKKVSDTINGAVIMYSIRNGRINNATILAFELLDKEHLKGILFELVEWGDFESLRIFLERLANKKGDRRTTVILSSAAYEEARQIVDSAEAVVARSIGNKLNEISALRDSVQINQQLGPIKGQLVGLQLYKSSVEHMKAQIDFIERMSNTLSIIDAREKEVLAMAEKGSVAADGVLMTRLTDKVFKQFKDSDNLTFLMKKTEKEVGIYINGIIALNIMPLAYLTGSRYKMENGVLTVTSIPNPKFANAPYHQEGSFARNYEDETFRRFLAEMYHRLNTEYVHTGKHHKSSMGEVTYDIYIPVNDAATFGTQEIAFANNFLKSIGIPFAPNHRALTFWMIVKLNLVAK